MSKHHVRQHHWHNGTLTTVEHFFDSLDEAIAHANKSEAHTVKVYDEKGELQHSITPAATSATYA
jgi:hypothetical protein